MEQIAKETLPRGYDIEWSGVTREEKDSGGQTVFIFGICLLFVYLLLAAQYESLLLPFPRHNFHCRQVSSVLIFSCNWQAWRIIFMPK